MTLEEALLKAKEGNFITNEYLDTYECIHYYNGKFYYEDGAVIPEDTMYENDYTKNANWRIKFTADQVDKEKLSKMHEKSQGLMLINSSYVEAIK